MECCEIKDNQLEMLLMQIKRDINEHSANVSKKLLEQDMQIVNICNSVKNNLNNTLRELFDSMEHSGELTELITTTVLSDLEQLRRLVNLPDNDIQDTFNKGGLIYFPDGCYEISHPIYIRDNTTVICSDRCVFKLKDNAKCVMFRTTNEQHKNITWIGGTIDGNDINQGRRESSATNANFDFSNAFRFLKVENLIVKNVCLKNIRGHALEHWNCNNVVIENIEIHQDNDLVNFPNGGSRRDGITGSSSNIIINNIHGFTDDDLIGFLAGSPWHESDPTDIENVTISNIFAEYKDNRPAYSCVRVNVAEGKTLKNVHVSNVYGHTQRPAIRLGGYDQYSGNIKNLCVENVNVKCLNNWDEEGIILIQQANIDKVTLRNVTGEGNGNYRPTFLFVNNAGIDELMIDNCNFIVNKTYDSRILFMKINESVLPTGISGDIGRIVVKDTAFKYEHSENILLLVQGEHINTKPIRLELTNLDYNSTKFKYVIAPNNDTQFSMNSPNVSMSNNLLDDALQKNGDYVLCNNGYIYTWVDGVRYIVNKKPMYVDLRTDVNGSLPVEDYHDMVTVKLNVISALTGIDGGRYGQQVTILCGQAGTTLTHSDSFRLKGAANVQLEFMHALTFVRDNTGRWIEISRNF